jgi:type IV pilus assembly protein PilB
MVTSTQLKESLRIQRATGNGEYVGEVLIRLGHVREVDVVTALVLQCNLPFIAVSRHQVDDDVLRLIPSEIARRGRLIPFDRIGNVLSVVMQNPLNDADRDEVEQLTHCSIATFISTKSEIDAALSRFYPISCV